MKQALWPDRWPAVAHHVLPDGRTCIDAILDAPEGDETRVRFELPCATCPQNTACLNAKRKELGPLLYDRELLTHPRTSESSLFPMELFEPCLRRGEQMPPHWRKPAGAEGRWRTVSAWDLAWSERTGGDFLVHMAGRVDLRNGQRKLLDITRWRGKSFDQQIQLIADMWALFPSDVVMLEGDASQRVWRQHMARNTAVPVLEHTSGGKQNLGTGVPSLLIALENRKWEIPFEAGSRKHDEVENFLSECEAFGWNHDRLEGVGEHDDTVMCWWHLSHGMDRFAAVAAPPERSMGVQRAD